MRTDMDFGMRGDSAGEDREHYILREQAERAGMAIKRKIYDDLKRRRRVYVAPNRKTDL